MATARDHISTIRSTEKLLSSDQMITDRVILAVLVSRRNMLANQRLNERKLWQTDSLFTNLCMELVEVPLGECCNYISEQTISRTKYKIPKINEGIYNYAIKGVYNVDTSKKFTETTPDKYIELLRLLHRKKETYFWIVNDYIYTTNPSLQAIKLSAFFEEHIIPIELLFPECGCGLVKYENEDICKNPLDREFKFAGYLSQALEEASARYLLQTYFQLATDKTSNQLDETSK